MSVQGVNSVNNIQQKTVQSPIEPQATEPKEGISDGTKLLLGSLAALAIGGGIYLATKGRGKGANIKSQTLGDEVKNPTNNTQLEELQKQAKNLKNKIKVAYQEKLESLFPIKNFDSLIVQDGFKQGGKTSITSSKDFNEAKDYITHLHENDGPHRDFYIPAKQLKNKIFNDVKLKLADLQKDSDWVELRKIRKNLLKQRTKENRGIIDTHIELIDNIFLSKVSKDSSISQIFEEFYGMNIKDAAKLAKHSTQQVFEKIDYKSKLRPFETNGMNIRQLKLSDFFKKEVKEWNNANDTINSCEETFKFLDTQKQKFIELKKNLAQEFRQSDDVKTLKELNRQIAELSKK